LLRGTPEKNVIISVYMQHSKATPTKRREDDFVDKDGQCGPFYVQQSYSKMTFAFIDF